MKAFYPIVILIALFLGCATAADTARVYDVDELTQELIDSHECSGDGCHIVDLPRIKTFQETQPDNIRDLLPWNPREPKPDKPNPEQPEEKPEDVSGDNDRLLNGELLRKFRDSMIRVIDSLTTAVVISTYILPVAVLAVVFGWLFYSGAVSLNGLKAFIRAVINLFSKNK